MRSALGVLAVLCWALLLVFVLFTHSFDWFPFFSFGFLSAVLYVIALDWWRSRGLETHGDAYSRGYQDACRDRAARDKRRLEHDPATCPYCKPRTFS